MANSKKTAKKAAPKLADSGAAVAAKSSSVSFPVMIELPGTPIKAIN